MCPPAHNACMPTPLPLPPPPCSHCLGTGDIMVSAMGDEDGNARGAFLLLSQDLKVWPVGLGGLCQRACQRSCAES